MEIRLSVSSNVYRTSHENTESYVATLLCSDVYSMRNTELGSVIEKCNGFFLPNNSCWWKKFSDYIILKKKHVTDDLILAWSSFQQVKVLLLFVQKKPKENLLWIFLVCVQTRYKVCLLWVHWTYSEIPPSCKTACRFLCSCLRPHCSKIKKRINK